MIPSYLITVQIIPIIAFLKNLLRDKTLFQSVQIIPIIAFLKNLIISRFVLIKVQIIPIIAFLKNCKVKFSEPSQFK